MMGDFDIRPELVAAFVAGVRYARANEDVPTDDMHLHAERYANVTAAAITAIMVEGLERRRAFVRGIQ